MPTTQNYKISSFTLLLLVCVKQAACTCIVYNTPSLQGIKSLSHYAMTTYRGTNHNKLAFIKHVKFERDTQLSEGYRFWTLKVFSFIISGHVSECKDGRYGGTARLDFYCYAA